VEGLRAVAVVAVLLYHAGVPFAGGGYVGVDVFFVISGFLITGLLVRELEKTKTVSLARFYSRRAKRLLPLTVVVLAVVVVLSWLLFDPVRMEEVSLGIVAAGAVEAGSRMGAVNPGERDKAGRGAEGAEGAKVTLRITGDRGTAFSGVCSDGEAERTVEGQAPERYTLEPRGKDVRCEVRNEGGGALGIVFTGGAGVRSEHRTGGAESTTRFVYLNGGVSSSTSSVAVEQGMARSGGSSEG